MLRKLRTRSAYVVPLKSGKYEVAPDVTLFEAFRYDRRYYGLRIALYNLLWMLTH